MKVIIPKDMSTNRILEYNIVENDHDVYDSTKIYLAGDKVMLGHRRYQAVVGDDVASIPVWSATTAYVSGAKCFIEATHKIYQCSKDTTNQYPPDYLTGDTAVWTAIGYYNKGVELGDATFWIDMGPTNYYAMFDDYTDTQTSGVLTNGEYLIDITINSSKCGSIALFNCSGTSVEIIHYDSNNTVVLDNELLLRHRSTTSWSDYFFGEDFVIKKDLYQEIPKLINSKLRIIIKGSTIAACGNMVVGTSKVLGMTKYDATINIIDYSTKETDDFGKTYLSPGKYKKRTSIDLYLDRSVVDTVYKQLASLRAIPAAYICDNSESSETTIEAMLIFGYYKDFSIVVSMPTMCDCQIEIEGLS